MLAQAAAAADPSSAIASILGGAGVAGAVVLALITGKLHTDSAMRQTTATLAFERARAEALQTAMMNQVIPALHEAASAMKAQAQRSRRAAP